MNDNFNFESFKPKLKPGKLIPTGAHLIFEDQEGRDQIVLPIEMADLLLLCNGQFSVRDIIEKIFKRRGYVHFRSVFAVIHQLRDYGFFLNGEDLEDSHWWVSYREKLLSAGFEWHLVKRHNFKRARPIAFYFLALCAISLSGLSLTSFPWPPVGAQLLFLKGSYLLGLLLGILSFSVISSCQALLKCACQILLTGQSFGMSLHLSFFGLRLKTNDEPIFLISNQLFLILYHIAVILSPFLFAWPVIYLLPELYADVAGISFIYFVIQLSPMGMTEFVRMVKSLLSFDQSDLIAGYIRQDSILAMISPLGEAKRARRWRRRFTAYFWLWTIFAVAVMVTTLKNLGSHLAFDPLGAALAWVGVMGVLLWTLRQTVTPIWNLISIPSQHLYRTLISQIRQHWRAPVSAESMVDILAQLPLFSYFSNALLQKIIDSSELMEAAKGTRIITQGEIGRHLYVLLKGRVLVEKNSLTEGKRKIGALQAITIFGEMAMVEESERTADIVAVEKISLLRVSAEVIKQLAQESQNSREINAFCNAVIVNQFFTSAPIFRELPEEIANNIITRSFLRSFSADDFVIRQGDMGKSFFMLLRGSVRVMVDGRLVKTIKQGGFFGEIAIFADIPRTATVIADENSLIFEMASGSFWEVLCQNFELAMFIEAVSEMRLREDLQGGLLTKPNTEKNMAS